jgi:ABC-2 type transport system ATP-binding protein
VGILERGRLAVAGPIGEISERLEARHAADAVGLEVGAAGIPKAQVFVPAPASTATPVVTDTPAAEPPPAPAAAEVQTAGGVPIPASTRKRLKLRVLGDSRAVMPLILGGSGILGVDPGAGGQLTVWYMGNDRFVADVVRHLVANGVGIVQVEPERNELERIFLEVTRGDLQ